MSIMKVFKDKKGFSYPLTIAVILSIIIVMCGISEYFRLSIIAKGVRDATEQAVISVVVDNWDDVYNGVRQGYTGGYILINNTWKEQTDKGAVYYHLANTLGLRYENNKYVKYTDDKMEFIVYNLDVDITNVSIRGNKQNEFNAEATITLVVPLSYGFEYLPNIVIPLQLKAKYIPAF